MLTKPIDQCDENELLAALAEANVTIDRFKVTLGAYSTAVRQKQRVSAILRDRFAIDPKTGRRIRRKGRGELDLTGWVRRFVLCPFERTHPIFILPGGIVPLVYLGQGGPRP